jgi:hypothetical protein
MSFQILIKKNTWDIQSIFFIYLEILIKHQLTYILILLINQLIHNETFISVMKIELTA